MRTMRRLTPLWMAMALSAGCATEPLPLDEARMPGLPELSAAVDEVRLRNTVEEVVAAHRSDTPLDCTRLGIPDATEDNPFCHHTREKAREYMHRELQELGYTVNDQVSRDGELDVANVVAEKRGTRFPDEVVLVGAHYDAFYAGADDNSTGVAAVLELARVLSAHSFERTVRFVGFDLEEFGLVGSTRYVNEQVKGEKVVVALILDSIGYRDTTPGSQQSVPPLSFPSAADFILATTNADSSQQADELWALNQRLGLTRVMTLGAPGNGNGPATGDLMRSDHAPFWLAGKPAIFLGDTADLRSPHYHQPTDTPDTVDFEFVAEVVRLSAVSLAYWAGGVQ
ncbi:M28 family peptidase [Archangium violaceum]|uniref:M28 family metallopeptidase n=1 Tax=Archangium violaceum TaxID=83451 RepID=UPI00193B13E9|nr:M28 family peptidase [Archangium violaceum]QRK09171.1 M28 family peptidase [Archangium violaceum]